MGKRRGKRQVVHDLIVPLDMAKLAADPKGYLEKLLSGKNRPRQFLLVVNGIETDVSFEDLEAFLSYCGE